MPNTARPAHGEGRDAILQAAITVVAAKGLRGLTFRAVAAEAGVSHALITYFFPTRDHLIHEAMRVASTNTAEATLDPARGLGLAAITEEFPRSIRAQLENQAFQYELTLEACRQPALYADAIELIEANLAALDRYLRSLGVATTPGLVRVIYAALDGLVLQELLASAAQDAGVDLAAKARYLGTALEDGALDELVAWITDALPTATVTAIVAERHADPSAP